MEVINILKRETNLGTIVDINIETAIEYLLSKLMFYFAQNNVEYAFLGTPSAKKIMSSDLDLCSTNASVFELALVGFCKKERCKILSKTFHATGVRYDLLFEYNGSHYVFPGPDLLIFPTWNIKGNIGLSYIELINNRVLDNEDYHKPSDIDEFVFYLIKRIDKGEFDQEQMQLLFDIFKSCDGLIEERLKGFFSINNARYIIELVKNKDFKAMNNAIPNLVGGLQEIEEFSVKRVSWMCKRFIERIFHPIGLVIVFLGSDGAGKTAVGDRLQEELAPAFRRVQRFHLRPYWFGCSGDEMNIPVIDPHGKPARSFLTSMAKLIYFWLDYTIGYWLKIRPLKVRSTLVIFDRYYHDLLIDPKRYRYGAPAWVARTIGKLIPKPDLFIILDAPAEVINARKQEVSLAETKKQRAAYLAFAKKQNNCIVINTDQSLDKTVHEGCMEIMDYMQKRQAKRIKKDGAK